MRRAREPVTPARIRIVRAGVGASAVGLYLSVLTLVVGHLDVTAGLVVAVMGAATVALVALCYGRALTTRVGMVAITAWVIAMLALVAWLGATRGPAAAEAHIHLAMLAFFAAVLLPRWPSMVSVLLALGGAAWVGVANASPLLELGRSTLLVAVIAVFATILGTTIGRELKSAIASRLDSDERAARLATVAASARDVHRLHPETVLHEIARTASGLGFEATAVCLYEEDDTFTVVAPHGPLAAAYGDRRVPLAGTLAEKMRSVRETIVIDDYREYRRANPELAAAGYQGVVASPVWVGDDAVGCLVAGSREAGPPSPSAVEAVELLAAQASQALENARRFAAEQEAVARLEELDRLKSDFVSNVSHELRTPLTVISGVAETLRLHGERFDDEWRGAMLGRLEDHASALAGIITRLLDFSRLEAGTLELRPEPVDLAHLVERVVERAATVHEGHRFSSTIIGDVHAVADPTLTERVLENLLTNAGSHTPPGTHVEVEVARIGGEIRVSVEDDGPGIPAADLANLTRRFFRGGDPDTRPTRGLGLGLALVREVLELHGSHLDVFSDPGRGARFAFGLPAAEPSAYSARARDNHPALTSEVKGT